MIIPLFSLSLSLQLSSTSACGHLVPASLAGFATSPDIFVYADQLLFNLQIYKPKSCSQPEHVRAPYKTTCRRTPRWSCWITRRLPWQTIEWFLGRWAMTQTSQTYNNFIGCHCETTKLVYPFTLPPFFPFILGYSQVHCVQTSNLMLQACALASINSSVF